MVTTYRFKHWQMVSIYSATHFLVDFACAFLMFRSIAGTPEGYLCVLLYNFFAFAVQMPIGIIADKMNKNFIFAIVGCILVGLAYGLVHIPIAAVVVIGIGNALFHIGGGIDVLNISGKNPGALGIFVSPGAFGIYYGTMLGKESGFSVVFILMSLAVAAVMIFVIIKAQGGTYPRNTTFSMECIGSSRSVFAVVCLFLVVCMRSYVGLALNFSWKSIGYWGTALICAVVFGKTLGGLLAAWFGIVRTSLLSLSIAALLFLFPQIPLAGVSAVLLFNMTMPITLWAVAKIMPGAKGFAFGLLTFGLFLGFLPVYLGVSIPSGLSWVLALIAALSLVLLMTGFRRAKL